MTSGAALPPIGGVGFGHLGGHGETLPPPPPLSVPTDATRQQRLDILRSSVGKKDFQQVKKSLYYPDFPPCEATETSEKILHGLQFVKHHISTFFKGTFLETQDAWLLKDAREGKDPSLAKARALAAINIIGKTLMGAGVIAAIPLTIGLGIAGGVVGAILTEGDGFMAGAYVGAIVGCGISAILCGTAGLIGSLFVAATEPDISGKDALKVIGYGTAVPVMLSLMVAGPIIGAGKFASEINYLQSGNLNGFFFLYAFGVPT